MNSDLSSLPPLKTWQFFHACRKTLGDTFLQKLYNRGLRQIYRWAADPDFTDTNERNPLDRFRILLERLCEIGREDIALWDTRTSVRVCEIFGEITGMQPGEMIRALLEEMARKLALEVLKRQLDEETDPDRLDDCEVCRVLIRNLLGKGNRDYDLQMRMGKPIVGIGAPVHLFLSEAASLLGAEAILPEHADVANAIGAVTSRVKVRRQVKIRPSQAGGFLIEGLPGAKRFLDFEEAMARAEEGLTRLVRDLALASGTSETSMEIDVDDHIHTTASGSQIFLRRTLSAELTGEPNHVCLSEEDRTAQ